ncbi:MAG: GlxA family transcriptional regulator [Gammaproteobacteria bacterium]|uniref:GlxA family transcriptional regulator n=1 Tax=Pseudacidovorax sp. TaxID=1934311 RepID=UPI001B69E20D|nr:helix-turn-helix domain-containing protein [Pseudacidovorax sp.]MBP6893796.1 helix-turn-helix domain-containing protein [Pseudacidovorax sp.]
MSDRPAAPTHVRAATTAATAPARQPQEAHTIIRVVFALLPDSLALDWAGPAEALRIANRLLEASGRPLRFEVEFAAAQPELRSSVGVQLAGLMPLPGAWDGRATWLVLVGLPGRHIDVDTPEARHLLHWLRGQRLEAGQLELLTICGGALLAAHAGLLAGRRATTHHHHLDELKASEPACEVVANRVFVLDAPVFSSAGVTTGIDLVLHRIGTLCGEALAAQVAQTMVMPLRRGPQDPELSPFLAHRHHLHAVVHRVQDAVSEAPQAGWTVPGMAALAHTSPRHLTRLFVQHAGVAPLTYLRRLRLEKARQAIGAGASVTQAAEASGFGTDTQLRRAWHQFGLPGTPARPSAA